VPRGVYLQGMDGRLQDVLLAIALAIGVVLQVLLDDSFDATVVTVAGALAITVPLAWRRVAPLAVVLVFAGASVVQAALEGGVYQQGPPPVAALIAGAVAFYSLGAHTAEREARLGLVAGVLALVATHVLTDRSDPQGYLFAAGLIGLSPWLAGRVVRGRELRSAALEQAAASEERQRIARELHDVVAHGVVLMVMQAQGARRIFDLDPERAREALGAIETTGQTALTELRHSLGILREDGARADLAPQPTLGDVADLVAEMRSAGLQVELRVEGTARELGEGVDRSAYRIVQEALTNTLKHAGLVPTRVTVSYGADDLTIEVADEGPGPGHDGSNGQGLIGMRERVRLYGGELDARSPNGDGFVVTARFPLPA
jgi:signal transduction histidine kinase